MMPDELGAAIGQVASLIARVAGDWLSAIVRSQVGPLEAEVRELRAAVEASRPEDRAELVTVAAAARLTGLSSQTLRTYAASGRIPSVRVGRAIRLDPRALRPVPAEVVATAARAAVR
jgi:excisionase family DNA binding protein